VVVFGAAVIFGLAPFASNPTAALKAINSGVERALQYLQTLSRDLLDAKQDPYPCREPREMDLRISISSAPCGNSICFPILLSYSR
jgi:hypothetical protein